MSEWLWTLTSMDPVLGSSWPVSPLEDLLPLSLGPETQPLSVKELPLCWRTLWLHNTLTLLMWLGDWEDCIPAQFKIISRPWIRLKSLCKVAKWQPSITTVNTKVLVYMYNIIPSTTFRCYSSRRHNIRPGRPLYCNVIMESLQWCHWLQDTLRQHWRRQWQWRYQWWLHWQPHPYWPSAWRNLQHIHFCNLYGPA